MILAKPESVHKLINRDHMYDFYYSRRSSFVIDQSISIIFLILANDQCNICMTQLRQLISLFHQI